MRFRVLLCTLLVVSMVLVPGLGVAQPHGTDAPEPITNTIDENGFCSNPAEDPANALWEREYDFGDVEVISIEVSLTWSDDEGSNSNPDSFTVGATDGDGNGGTDSGSDGTLSYSIDMEGMNSTWTLSVECTEAGMTPVWRVGVIGTVDPGNSWSLEFTYTYIETEVPTGPMGPPPEIAALMEDPVFWVHVGLMIASTIGFGVVGLLAAVSLFTANRWKDSAERLKRLLSGSRLYRVLAVHTWVAFFIAAVPLGMYVAGKAYGWENAWSGFPAIWNPSFYEITNADHTSTIALVLFGIPLWLNRKILMAPKSHRWFFRHIPWVRKQYATAPDPIISKREMAIIYFLLGVMIFLVFAVQPHGN
jgi:hypothetical protein